MPKKKTARPEMYWDEKRQEWRKRIKLEGMSAPKDIRGKTQEEVREKIRDLERQVDSGLVLNDKTTLALFAREWYSVKIASLSFSSKKKLSNVIVNHLAPFFKDIKLADIRPLHVHKLLANSSSLSKATQTIILGTLNQILNAAVENCLLVKNPCVGVSASGTPTKAKNALTFEQLTILLQKSINTRAYTFVALCLYTGIRREEALGLKWDSLFLVGSHPYLHVQRVLRFESNKGVLSTTLKSKASNRKIPIPAALLSILLSEKTVTKGFFVIADCNGKAMTQTSFRRMWAHATKSIDFSVSPHVLRHTYITELCASGLDIKKVQYLAGHATVSLTLNVYAHVTQNTPEELGESIDAIFSRGQTGGQLISSTVE